MRALIAMTSQERVTKNGRPTGVYLPEVSDAWRVFAAAGYDIDMASVAGGKPPLEAVNPDDPQQQAFFADPVASAKLESTPTAASVDGAAYDIVFFAGGHGGVEDYPLDDDMLAVARDAYEAGGVVAAVCHGPAALVNARLSDGRYLVDGKRVTCFSNDEERAVGMTDVVPFLLADKLSERGGVYESGGSFLPHVAVDGRLVTGQNPMSAERTASEAVDAALTARGASRVEAR